jgi:hypothetical protein
MQYIKSHARLEIEIHSFSTSVLNAGCQLHVPAVLPLEGALSTYLLERWLDGSVGMDICTTELFPHSAEKQVIFLTTPVHKQLLHRPSYTGG